MSKQKNKRGTKQGGGTLLGIIIGLILGLAIAVVVAVAINKTALPFTNRIGKPDKPPGQGAVTDPNKPLYGARPAPKEPVPQITAPSAPEPAPATDPVAEKKARAAENAEEAKAAKAKAEDADEKWIYYLQAGAFREAPDAENIKAKLALLGFEARISEHQSDNGTLYRVRIGPYGQLEAMNRVRGKLSDNGVDVAVVRVGK